MAEKEKKKNKSCDNCQGYKKIGLDACMGCAR